MCKTGNALQLINRFWQVKMDYAYLRA